MFDAAVDSRLQSLDRSGQLEPVQPSEQMTEDRLELDAREVRAHAEVLTEAEGEVRIRVPVDAERERVVEDVLVAIRRTEVQRELITRPDRDVVDLAVLGRDAGEV